MKNRGKDLKFGLHTHCTQQVPVKRRIEFVRSKVTSQSETNYCPL